MSIMSYIADIRNLSEYMDDADNNFLLEYVENIKHCGRNNVMLVLCGPSGSGKSTIRQSIIEYLGSIETRNLSLRDNIIAMEHIPKLICFCDHFNNISPKAIRTLLNLIKYGQSCVFETTNMDSISPRLRDNCRVIYTKTIF